MPPGTPLLEVEVEGLGPIGHAKVAVKPITLFVGENNSGKSYLSLLLWGIETADVRAFNQPNLEGWQEAFRRVEGLLGDAPVEPWGSPALDPDPGRETVQDQILTAVVAAGVTAVHEAAVQWLIGDLFQGALSTPKVRVHRSGPGGHWALRRLPNNGGPPIDSLRWRRGEEPWVGSWAVFGSTAEAAAWTLNLALSRESGWSSALDLSYGFMGPANATVFLPASRTGYVHLLPWLMQQFLGSALPGFDAQRITLPPHVVQFIRTLLPGPSGGAPGVHAQIAAELEQSLIRGDVSQASNGEFRFRPHGAEIEVSPTQASSVVTELLPFIHLLRTAPRIDTLYFEEPEAHLHPHLQRMLARVLVRLANRGVKLVLSTHSDFLVQQINLAVRLGSIKARVSSEAFAEICQKLNVTEDSALPSTDLGAYEFKRAEDGRTVVTEISVGDWGAPMPLFNDEIDEMRAEMDRLVDL